MEEIPSFPKKAPELYGGFFLQKLIRLSDGVLQSLAGLERRDLHRGDGDLLRRIAGVHARACSAVAELEGAKTGDRNRRALLQVLRDNVDDRLESVTSCALRDTCGVSDCGDKILLRHRKGVRRK